MVWGLEKEWRKFPVLLFLSPPAVVWCGALLVVLFPLFLPWCYLALFGNMSWLSIVWTEGLVCPAGGL